MSYYNIYLNVYTIYLNIYYIVIVVFSSYLTLYFKSIDTVTEGKIRT